ncbi:hypothetical protein [Mesorhizobium sp. M0496]|uniref:hypothetical protein n=1 Tax=Mesorhizobium sp. M0496 TaxID=2956952 RepID=UPI003334D8BA
MARRVAMNVILQSLLAEVAPRWMMHRPEKPWSNFKIGTGSPVVVLASEPSHFNSNPKESEPSGETTVAPNGSETPVTLMWLHYQRGSLAA